MEKELTTANYQKLAVEAGIPHRPDGCFAEDDSKLAEYKQNPKLKPFQKHLNVSRLSGWSLVDSYATGNGAARNGCDLRYFADMSTIPADPKKVKDLKIKPTVKALFRYTSRACIGSHPAHGFTAHGGAFQTVMDEATAEVMKFFVQPNSSTRKIDHQIMKPIYPYTTYEAVCTVEDVRPNGCVYNIKGIVYDIAGEIVGHTKVEMVDVPAMNKFMAESNAQSVPNGGGGGYRK